MLPIGTRPSFLLSQPLPSGTFQKPLSFSIRGEMNENHNHRKLTNLITRISALFNLMKLWAMPHRATKEGRVMAEGSDKMWSTGEGNGKLLQYSCLEYPKNDMKRQNDKTRKDELPRSVSAQYSAGDKWRNNCRKNEEIDGAKATTPPSFGCDWWWK